MLPYPPPTPCPGSSSALDLLPLQDENDTDALDFTTEFRVTQGRAAPPRRPKASRRGKGSSSFAIHDDGPSRQQVETRGSARVDLGERGDLKKRKSILAQPAQRMKAGTKSGLGESAVAKEGRDEPGRAQRMTASTAMDPPQSRSSLNEGKKIGAVKKPRSRRADIYVPSEDTTIPSMYMGVFSPLKTDWEKEIPAPISVIKDVRQQDEEPKVVARKNSRNSMAQAPKRAPLGTTLKPIQEHYAGDRIGDGRGKENVPPWAQGFKSEEKTHESHEKLYMVKKHNAVESVAHNAPRAATSKPTTSISAAPHSSTRESILGRKATAQPAGNASSSDPFFFETKKRHADGSPKRTLNGRMPTSTSLRRSNSDPRKKKADVVVSHPTSKSSPLCPASSRPRPTRPEKAPSKLSIPSIPNIASSQKYPLLSANIVNPELYEDDWLSHQEIAITQLINGFFTSVAGQTDAMPEGGLQYAMLDLYQNSSFSLLFKRLYASLLYGALATPKDSLPQVARLKDDLGQRRKFLDVWMETYDLQVLKAAAEVVIGRTIPSLSESASTSQLRKEKKDKRAIETFLETFLLRNEDSSPTGSTSREEPGGIQGHDHRRTLLRSLLLIQLLDRAKASSIVAESLFQTTSPYKSSVTLLQAVGKILLPSVGDITRPLAHLDYTVSYIQYPLQEYAYEITNLAVDLRDGVRLTRLVETLLYPPPSLQCEVDANATTTVMLPSGDTLALEVKDGFPLSQHLKFPCIGRATKLYNVQIALSALQGVRGVESICETIKAEDVVDGHREKTLKLLWGLVGRWGLPTMLDWDDVVMETRRLKKKLRPDSSIEVGEEDEQELATDDEDDVEDLQPYERSISLLRSWSRACARIHGFDVHNLSTSFADGNVFGAIVDEYAAFISSTSTSSRTSSIITTASTTKASSLPNRLKSIGCSTSFATLFQLPTSTSTSHSHSGRVFNRDFTLAALAFLASRLLGATKRARAAACLQRAWRSFSKRWMLRRRVRSFVLAGLCRKVVLCRARVKWAVDVLEQAWMGHLERKRRPQTLGLEDESDRDDRKGGREPNEDEDGDGDSCIWIGA